MDRPRTSSGRSPPPADDPYAFGMPRTAYEPDYFDDVAHDYPPDIYEEEEEESEDEDVFAYLPPTTAERQQEHLQALALQQQQQPPSYPSANPILDNSDQFFPRASYSTQLSQLPFSVPTPAKLHHRAPPPHSAPSTGSTTSHIHPENAGPDAFRMRSMPSPIDPPPPATSIGHSSGRGNISLSRSGVSSREVRVTLPSRGSSIDLRTDTVPFEEYEYDLSSRPKRRKESGSFAASELGLEEFDPDKTPPRSSHPANLPFSYPEYEEEEDSPYPEVRASVSNIDDPEMPTLTARMWLIGLTLSIIGTALNTFFNFRYPAPQLQPLVLLLIAHPCGKFLAYCLPIRTFTITFPTWMGLGIWGKKEPLKAEFNFNPGPFNIKVRFICACLLFNVQPFVSGACLDLHHDQRVRLSSLFSQCHRCRTRAL